jgi:hypothetical protein
VEELKKIVIMQDLYAIKKAFKGKAIPDAHLPSHHHKHYENINYRMGNVLKTMGMGSASRVDTEEPTVREKKNFEVATIQFAYRNEGLIKHL